MYNNGFLVLPPSMMLNDVMALLFKCHGLSNGDNGKVLALTNSPTSDFFH